MKFLSLPYQGSKLKIAERIINTLPKAEHLFDIFAGGCSISHCAMVSGKWRHVHISDTNDSVLLFRDILEGNIPDGSEWISREEFYARRDTDPYIRIFWSFANNQRDYIYSRQIEPYKKAVHEMIYAETPNERRLKFKTVCKLMAQIGGGGRPGDIAHIERSQRINNQSVTPPNGMEISRLETSERYARNTGSWNQHNDNNRCREALEAKPFLRGEYDCRVCDYREVDILPDSVIYADPPYIGTCGYRYDTFDHAAFYDWCEAQEQPVFISEYTMPEDRFFEVAQWERVSTFSATDNGLKKIEKLFMPLKFRDWWDNQDKKTKQLELF